MRGIGFHLIRLLEDPEKSEFRNPKSESMTNDEIWLIRHWDFVIFSDFELLHSDFGGRVRRVRALGPHRVAATADARANKHRLAWENRFDNARRAILFWYA